MKRGGEGQDIGKQQQIKAGSPFLVDIKSIKLIPSPPFIKLGLCLLSGNTSAKY